MSDKANPYDNAKMESFFRTLKVEEVYMMITKLTMMCLLQFHILLKRCTTEKGYILH